MTMRINGLGTAESDEILNYLFDRIEDPANVFEHVLGGTLDLKADNPYGYKATFNPTFPDRSRHKLGWMSPYHYGINQGPIVIAIENYRSGFVWQLMKGCLCVVQGLRRAGFREGWLS